MAAPDHAVLGAASGDGAGHCALGGQGGRWGAERWGRWVESCQALPCGLTTLLEDS